ncbi:MAG TPA: hypothetical protein VJ836_05375 [Candidatus Saccharimonadales bacterium]|nr:hypothetical protein [Candidatus Saccharimonadales bacterium]
MSETTPHGLMTEDFTPAFPHSIVQVWDRLGASEVFGNEERSLQWAHSLQYSKFKKWLCWLNGNARQIARPERGFASQDTALFRRREGKTTILYMAPALHTRDPLLREAYLGLGSLGSAADMGRMLAAVLFELQGYEDGNKRTAREIYGLGVYGYHGTPIERWRYSMSVYNKDPRTQIDFIGLHRTLAERYALHGAAVMAKALGLRQVPAIEPMDPLLAAITCENLEQTEAHTAAVYLDEPYFNVPLALRWLYRTGRDTAPYMTSDGCLSAKSMIDSMSFVSYTQLLGINDDSKSNFIRAIISNFIDGDTRIFGEPIAHIIDPPGDLPKAGRPSAEHVAQLALAPIFSELHGSAY